MVCQQYPCNKQRIKRAYNFPAQVCQPDVCLFSLTSLKALILILVLTLIRHQGDILHKESVKKKQN